MKKRDLWTGVAFLIAAAACLIGALMLSGTALGSLLCGMTGGIGVPGFVMVYKYFKWSSPKHAAEYRERLEQEQIELRYDQEDETELLIRVLSFGPVLEVKAPAEFISLVKERVDRQTAHMFQTEGSVHL